MNLIGQSKQIVGRGLNRDELEERLVKLETLAKNIVLSEYGELLSATDKPVNLIINYLEIDETFLRRFLRWMTYQKPIKQEVIRDADIRNAVDKRRY
jgi:hypothetical protein